MVYVWIAISGVSGFFALAMFLYFWLKNTKLRRELGLPKRVMVADVTLLLLAGGAFTVTVFLLQTVKEQLLQLTS